MYALKDIKARVHEVPVTIPLWPSRSNDGALSVAIVTDGGLTGFGLTGQFLPFAIQAALVKHLLPLLRGTDIRDTEAVHHRVWKAANPRSQTGVVSHALAALDIAMWDAAGKGSERSIAKMIGGSRDRAPVYVTFGFPEYDRDELVEAAKLQVAAGVRRLKMVVGVHRDGWAEDARRVRAVREAIGDDVELAIDANYMFSPLEAYLLAREVADTNLTWFEEPLYSNDPRAMAELRSRAACAVGRTLDDTGGGYASSSMRRRSTSSSRTCATPAATPSPVRWPTWRRPTTCRSPTAAAGPTSTCT